MAENIYYFSQFCKLAGNFSAGPAWVQSCGCCQLVSWQKLEDLRWFWHRWTEDWDLSHHGFSLFHSLAKSSSCGNWVPRVKVETIRSRNAYTPDLIPCDSCHIPLVKTSYKNSPHSRGWRNWLHPFDVRSSNVISQRSMDTGRHSSLEIIIIMIYPSRWGLTMSIFLYPYPFYYVISSLKIGIRSYAPLYFPLQLSQTLHTV